MNDGAEYLKFNGGFILVVGLVLLVFFPPIGLLAIGLGLLIHLFGRATAPIERQVMEEARGGGGCGLLFALVVVGVLFFVLLAGGSLVAIEGWL